MKRQAGTITRGDIRTIKPGQTKIFACGTARARESGKVVAYQVQRLDGIKVKIVRSPDPTILCVQRVY